MSRSLSVVIVGAGFGGVAAAISAKRAGVEQITLLEQGDAVGGVWQHNTYPGIACDVPSHLYEFSFAPNPAWTRRYSPGNEIRSYCERLARDHGIYDAIRFGASVTSASFDEEDLTWTVAVDGDEPVTADVLITAVGQLNRPLVPDFPGASDFSGTAFHSARWDHAHDLRGRRVVVVGTGASALQFVPRIAEQAAHVTVIQRSAPWILPKLDAAFSERTKALYARVPLPRVYRKLYWRTFESLVPVLTRDPERLERMVTPVLRTLATRFREFQLRGDEELLAATAPDSLIGCKRLGITSEWYPTLRRPNVSLVASAVDHVRADAVVTADGAAHACDTLIYATGFTAADLLAPIELTGRDGATLAEAWKDGAQAYLGLTIPRFPNLFMVYGPHTNHGTGSVITLHEAQMSYLEDAFRLLRSGAAEVLEVRRGAHERFEAEMDRRAAKTVWASGCHNWYINAMGKVANNWPGYNDEYTRRVERVQVADFYAELPSLEEEEGALV